MRQYIEQSCNKYLWRLMKDAAVFWDSQPKNEPRGKQTAFLETFPPTVGKSKMVHVAGPGEVIVEQIVFATPPLFTQNGRLFFY